MMRPDRVFQWLAILVLAGLFVVFLCEQINLSALELNAFIFKYRAVIMSLGTLSLVILTGVLTTVMTNHYAERREAMNRKISAALAVAEFRQKWINSLRDDLASFSGKVATDTTPVDALPGGMTLEETTLATKILLQMNPDDKDYKKLHLNLKSASEQRQISKDRDLTSIAELRHTSQTILKREWERLKDDLEKAQSGLDGRK